MRRLFLCLALAASASAAPPAAFAPFFQKNCIDCHDSDVQKGGLDLTSLAIDLTKPDIMRVWVGIHDKVSSGEMPPAKKPQPAPVDKGAFLQTLAGGLNKFDVVLKGTVLRRLNRVEYENTLHDLLGIEIALAELLPADNKAHGFDNVGEALDLSSVQLQRYMEAAGKALTAATRHGPQPESKPFSFTYATSRTGKEQIGKSWLQQPDGAVVIFTSGNYPNTGVEGFRSAEAGSYRVKITGYGYQCAEPIQFELYSGSFGRNSDSVSLGWFTLKDKPTTVETMTHLEKGQSFKLVPYDLRTDDNSLRKDGPSAYKGRGLAIQKVEIEGPLYEEWPGKGHKLLFGDLVATDTNAAAAKKNKYIKPAFTILSTQPEADAMKLLQGFIPRAFRRPVASDGIAPYFDLFKSELASGSTFEEALRTAYIAVLCSPDFLYLREKAGRLDDFALASRLSYMLWATTPDVELLAAASRGELSKPAGLHAQTERLLKDPKAERFTQNFTGQWLNLRAIDATTPDKQLYPEYDDMLKDAMVKETELFFDEILKNNLSIANFIDSGWTMMNQRLARHYHIDGVEGSEFRKVSLKPEAHRGGLLTQAGVLKVSANGTTTSPVVRGVYVMDRILGLTPPPPPPGIPGVEPDIRGATTLRQQLDQHRKLETCNGCHKAIDPPGFALENYDVMGGWRENYRSLGKNFPKPPADQVAGVRNPQWKVGPPVDAAGQTADGKTFANLADFKKLILSQPLHFARALTEKLAVYSTGRGMSFSDRPELDRITASVASKGGGFRDLVHAVIESEIFASK